MRFLIFCILVACGKPVPSPWQNRAPNSLTQLTKQNLEILSHYPQHSENIEIAIIADPQAHPLALEKIVRCINTHESIDFTVVVGDLTEYGLMHEYLWAVDSLSKLKSPWLTLIGNHDSLSYGRIIYQKIFGEFSYTLDFGGSRFAFWNNNILDFGESNLSWLEQNLNQNSVVFAHIPPIVDQHSPSQIDDWLQVYENFGVRLSIHGHRGHQKGNFFKLDHIGIFIAPKANKSVYSVLNLNQKTRAVFRIYDGNCRRQAEYADD